MVALPLQEPVTSPALRLHSRGASSAAPHLSLVGREGISALIRQFAQLQSSEAARHALTAQEARQLVTRLEALPTDTPERAPLLSNFSQLLLSIPRLRQFGTQLAVSQQLADQVTRYIHRVSQEEWGLKLIERVAFKRGLLVKPEELIKRVERFVTQRLATDQEFSGLSRFEVQRISDRVMQRLTEGGLVGRSFATWLVSRPETTEFLRSVLLESARESVAIKPFTLSPDHYAQTLVKLQKIPQGFSTYLLNSDWTSLMRSLTQRGEKPVLSEMWRVITRETGGELRNVLRELEYISPQQVNAQFLQTVWAERARKRSEKLQQDDLVAQGIGRTIDQTLDRGVFGDLTRQFHSVHQQVNTLSYAHPARLELLGRLISIGSGGGVNPIVLRQAMLQYSAESQIQKWLNRGIGGENRFAYIFRQILTSTSGGFRRIAPLFDERVLEQTAHEARDAAFKRLAYTNFFGTTRQDSLHTLLQRLHRSFCFLRDGSPPQRAIDSIVSEVAPHLESEMRHLISGYLFRNMVTRLITDHAQTRVPVEQAVQNSLRGIEHAVSAFVSSPNILKHFRSPERNSSEQQFVTSLIRRRALEYVSPLYHTAVEGYRRLVEQRASAAQVARQA